jgi:hypothetical protein
MQVILVTTGCYHEILNRFNKCSTAWNQIQTPTSWPDAPDLGGNIGFHCAACYNCNSEIFVCRWIKWSSFKKNLDGSSKFSHSHFLARLLLHWQFVFNDLVSLHNGTFVHVNSQHFTATSSYLRFIMSDIITFSHVWAFIVSLKKKLTTARRLHWFKMIIYVPEQKVKQQPQHLTSVGFCAIDMRKPR